jgi:hypothetical protein
MDTRLEGQHPIIAQTFVWFPWSLAAVSRIASDPHLDRSVRKEAEAVQIDLSFRLPELRAVINREFIYVRAESIICLVADEEARENAQ